MVTNHKFLKSITVLLPLFWLSAANIYAQKIVIPDVMYFAGMKLYLSKGARAIIEKDYISITRNQKYFTSIVQRADLYFPIIENVFKAENAPPDFKFLALQESSLQSDVVSKSNAVGYWQFKKESAQEVGLQVDSDIDERKNIVASSQGAAKYLKKGNAILNNWVYTLLAYYLGRSGVMPYVKEQYRNANEMDINEDMNWYVLRFLAHKYAYERQVGLIPHPQLRLALYKDANGKTLKQIAEDKNLDIIELENFNKWLNINKIPQGRSYTVILPFKISQDISGENIVVADHTTATTIPDKPIAVVEKPQKKNRGKNKEKTKEELGFDPIDLPLVVEHNKLKAVQARNKDSFAKLAFSGSITTKQFLKHNELESFDNIISGQLYYLEPKRNKALVMHHTVKFNETIWAISQRYGIRIASIRKKNRMKMKENIHTGQELWLRDKISKEQKNKPATTPLFMRAKELEATNPTSEPNPPEEVITETPSIPNNIPENNDPVVPTEPAPANSNDTIVIDARGEEIPTEIPQVATSPVIAPVPTTTDVIKNNILKDSIQWHIVEAGQTLYSISRTFAAPVDTLKKWNNLPTNEISIGKALIVKKIKPIIRVISKTTSIYTVKKGDTIYRIARENDVSVEDILRWNNKETMILSIGENVTIIK